ncbi:MAG: tetraacyldisaccharide 4'-kinase [Spirochaetia bacterium]|nr:tetraacyldisaccharide 4'-kinase [Spirochaetia bacterium]
MKNILSLINPIEIIYLFLNYLNKRFTKSKVIPDSKVISIGNITTGGTGKTPAVIYVSRILKNKKIGILSRGYGGRKEKTGGILSDGHKIKMSELDSGDEPYLLAANVKNIPVAIGKNRYKSALLLKKKYNLNLFLLDDGFQHYALKRNLDIVIIDASNPFGIGHLLPVGSLREPVSALERSHLIILSKCDLITKTQLNSLINTIEKLSKHQNIFKSIHKPVSLIKLPKSYGINFQKDKEINLRNLRNKKIWALSSIGNPKAYKKMLLNLGVKEVKTLKFKDHHKYTVKNIQSIIKKTNKNDFIITTEKDWIRLQTFADLFNDFNNFYYLKIEFTIIEKEKIFQKKLLSFI